MIMEKEQNEIEILKGRGGKEHMRYKTRQITSKGFLKHPI